MMRRFSGFSISVQDLLGRAENEEILKKWMNILKSSEN
jgi:hypothetical protein